MTYIRFLPLLCLMGFMAACSQRPFDPDMTLTGGTGGVAKDAGTGGMDALFPDGPIGGTGNTCVPVTCASLGKNCGVTGDGCGGLLECGTCTPGQVCGVTTPNVCTDLASFCMALSKDLACDGKQCGIEGDGCGGTHDCGSCPSDQRCGFEDPFQCAPVPPGSPDACPAKIENCAQVGAQCGFIGNGCGGILDCDTETGGCPVGQFCGLGGPQVCGALPQECQPQDPQNDAGVCTPACTPLSKEDACLNKNCGLVGDGCGGTHSCGTCPDEEQCGLITAFRCDPVPDAQCIPRTPAEACAGKQCGVVYDGCGGDAAHAIDCGTCTQGTLCGVNQTFQCGVLAPPPCTPAASCTELGWACGMAVDDCGNVFDCTDEDRTCRSVETCMGGVDGPTQCVIATNQPCPLCDAVPNCGVQGQTTKLTGRVVTPGQTNGNAANQLGVPNAFVYILRSNNLADLPPIQTGLSSGTSCDRCSDQELGPVLASAVTDASGYYTLQDTIPVGQEFLLVVKVGKFRRAVRVTIPVGDACKTTQFAASLPNNPTRLPRHMNDGLAVNIPRVAVATGQVDAMECVFYKMGIGPNEFTRPQLNTGRIHLYRLNGAWPDQVSYECNACGTVAGMAAQDCRSQWCGGPNLDARNNFLAAVDYIRLHENNGRISEYDMAVFDCEAGYNLRPIDNLANVRKYVNQGGRLFASHFSSSWLEAGGPQYSALDPIGTGLLHAATWDNLPAISNGTGVISIGRPNASSRIGNFATWMVNEGVTTAPDYHFDILEPRSRAVALGPYSEEFVHCDGGNCMGNSARTQQFSFNTPYGAPPAATCGRVAYSGFHVSVGSGTSNEVFPHHCTGNLTNEEKVLLYMLFDLGACVGSEPEVPECVPQACAPDRCGPQPDGCGGIRSCGCGAGSVCLDSHCIPECKPITCADKGANCGFISNGCGDVISCGTCEAPQSCGGGGIANVCGVPQCKPLTCADVEANCGIIGDGCGDIVDCGGCPAGQACGIEKPNQCFGCVPRSCESANANCGQIGDGCGGVLDCGQCAAGLICGALAPNRCGEGPCTALTCQDAGASCGKAGDGCGGLIDCGTCAAGKLCGINTPFQCGDAPTCQPTTCAQQNAFCGAIGDGCGGVLDCGQCAAGLICGALEPNQCYGVL